MFEQIGTNLKFAKNITLYNVNIKYLSAGVFLEAKILSLPENMLIKKSVLNLCD